MSDEVLSTRESGPGADPGPTAPQPRRGSEDDGEHVDWVKVGIVVGVLLVLLAGAIFAWTRFVGNLDSPEAAVGKMMTAYAAYDAQALLDSTTHYSITKDAEAAFVEQSVKAKQRAGGKPLVRKVDIVSVESQGEDKALVRVSAEWLTDPDKGTYRLQTQPVPVVRKDGKWIVQMF